MSLPGDPGIVLARDLLHYKITVALLVAGGARIALTRRGQTRRLPKPTPAWDAAWFIPAYAWGVESLAHLRWWLVGGEFLPWAPAFLAHGEFSVAVLVCVTALCMIEEHIAGRVFLPARATPWTVPAPVMAGTLGVLATWLLCSMMWMPVQ